MCDEDPIRKKDNENPDNYVLDRGALLHRIRWFKGVKFNAVSEVYAKYIRKNYRGCVIVIFDGYQDEGMKTHKHLRRNSNSISKAAVYISTKKILRRLQ